MTLSHLTQMFNRSIKGALDLKKIILLFVMLFCVGVFYLITQAFAHFATDWLGMFFNMLSIVFAIGVMLFAGGILTKLYFNKDMSSSLQPNTLFRSSWGIFLRSAYIALGFLAVFLSIWLATGVFWFLNAIPYFGYLMSTVFVFGPFFLNLIALLVCFAALFVLFFCTPFLASEEPLEHRSLLAQLKKNYFSNALFLVIAVVPVWIVFSFVLKATRMTVEVYGAEMHFFGSLVQVFFIMLPFLAVLTPALIFFFNFAAEASVMIQQDDS
ncbi:MAG: hypothetical protein S4CHLAM123_10390 [Chlamydiales bacterium]|nr:hypothetical protein [Chlamydiales bacterium]